MMDKSKTEYQSHNFIGGKIQQLAENTLMISYTDVEFIDAKHVIATQALRKKILGDIRYYAIIDMRNGFIKFSKEAKQWVAENPEGAKARILDIFLVDSALRKLEVKLYLRLFKPKVKTVVASSLEEALDLIDKDKHQ